MYKESKRKKVRCREWEESEQSDVMNLQTIWDQTVWKIYLSIRIFQTICSKLPTNFKTILKETIVISFFTDSFQKTVCKFFNSLRFLE